MITHHIEWYEAEDGEIFTDEMECLDHELQLLYQGSGCIFYIGRKPVKSIETDGDEIYNKMTGIRVDRSNPEKIAEFREFIHWTHGWSEIEDILDGDKEGYVRLTT